MARPRRPSTGKRGPITDHLDLKRLHARDPELLTELVRELSPRIWVAIRRYARDDDQSDDLLQDCWVRILERLDTYRRDGSFAAWALEVSRNLCRMKARARKRAVEVVPVRNVDEQAGGDPGSAAGSPQTEDPRRESRKRVVYAALGRLPDRERDVIVLRLLEGRTTAEAAEIVGVSERAVRMILVRGMTRLRQMEELRELLGGWNAPK